VRERCLGRLGFCEARCSLTKTCLRWSSGLAAELPIYFPVETEPFGCLLNERSNRARLRDVNRMASLNFDNL
jgi:hypothetical protein